MRRNTLTYWLTVTLLALGLIGVIKVAQAQPLAKRVHELGNYNMLNYMVENTDEYHRQAVIAILLVQQYVESGFDPDAKSSANALGISQILPYNLKKILNLNKAPTEISLDLGIYAQVKWFDDSYEHNLQRLKEEAWKLGVRVRLHHVVNMYLIQYIGGKSTFGSSTSYQKVLLGERHTEPKRRSKHHQPYAVNLYVTKILGVFSVLSDDKQSLPKNIGKRRADIANIKIKRARQLLKDLGYDLDRLKSALLEIK